MGLEGGYVGGWRGEGQGGGPRGGVEQGGKGQEAVELGEAKRGARRGRGGGGEGGGESPRSHLPSEDRPGSSEQPSFCIDRMAGEIGRGGVCGNWCVFLCGPEEKKSRVSARVCVCVCMRTDFLPNCRCSRL